MAQSTTVMAFRKRLKNHGYTNISIKEQRGYFAKPDTYNIRAIEPLGKTIIKVEYTITEMHHSFR